MQPRPHPEPLSLLFKQPGETDEHHRKRLLNYWYHLPRERPSWENWLEKFKARASR